MKISLLFGSLTLISLVAPTLGAQYSRSDSIVGPDFLNAFDFEAGIDPTHGRVNYVNQSTALQEGLVSFTPDSFTMGADHTTVLDPNGPGRDSVRIKSKNVYSTHVSIFNINHMPQGCGTWPAVWETNEDAWPYAGEVDILEGINDQAPNQFALHTSPNCTMPTTSNETGTVLATNCDTSVNFNDGCVVQSNDNSSYGPAFNINGGGWYAMERTNSFIKVWFWERDDPSVPSDVSSCGPYINTDSWGTPTAYFSNGSCDLASHFGLHNIIINLTFCGDRAGQADVYSSAGCPSTCVDYVNNNPKAFVNAYFDFTSIHVYTPTNQDQE